MLNRFIQWNKAGYTATLVACGWAGAVLEKVSRASGQEPYAQKAQKRQKSKKLTNQPTNQPTNRLTNEPTNQPTNESTNKSTNLPTNRPINQSQAGATT